MLMMNKLKLLSLILLTLSSLPMIGNSQPFSTKHYWLSIYYSDRSLSEPVLLSSIYEGFLVAARIEDRDSIAVFKINQAGDIDWSIALDSRGKTLNQIVGLGTRYALINFIEGYPPRIEVQFLNINGSLSSSIHLSHSYWLNARVLAVSTFENRLILIVVEPAFISIVLMNNVGMVINSKRVSLKGVVDLSGFKFSNICYSKEINTVLVTGSSRDKVLLISLDSLSGGIKWIRVLNYPLGAGAVEVYGTSCLGDSYAVLTVVSSSDVSGSYVTFLSWNGEIYSHFAIEGVDSYFPISVVKNMDTMVVAGFTRNQVGEPKLFLAQLGVNWSVLKSLRVSVSNATRYHKVESVADGFLIWGECLSGTRKGLFLLKIKDIMNIPPSEGLSSDRATISVIPARINSSVIEYTEYSFSPDRTVSTSPSSSAFVVRAHKVYSYVEVLETASKQVEDKAFSDAGGETGTLAILLAPILIPLTLTVLLFIYVYFRGRRLLSTSS